MSSSAQELCLDTSVWMKLWLPEQDSDLVHELIAAALQGDWGLIAPPTLAYEVASVLRVKVRRGFLDEGAAQEVWDAFRGYPIRVQAEPAQPDDAWALTKRLRLPTAYDAAFIAAAGKGWLVTEDRALLDACAADPTLPVLGLDIARARLLGGG